VLPPNPFDPPRPAARPTRHRRRTFRRRRRSPIAVAAALAVFGVLVLLGLGSGADPGPGTGSIASGTRPVAVAARELPAGTVLVADDLTWRALPADAVGPNALTDDGDQKDGPLGRVVTTAIDAGEVVSRRRLAPEGVHGLAALVPKGSVAVAVARDEHTPPLERGQRVNVLTTAGLDPTVPALGTESDGAPIEAQRVAKNALVVDVGEDRVLIAVHDDESGTVAAAVLDGAVVLALAGS